MSARGGGAKGRPASPDPSRGAEGNRPRFTHLDATGDVRMVDVGAKSATRRTARARARLAMRPSTLEAILQDRIVKGNVLLTAKIAGILAAKKVSELVPLCHSIPVDWVNVTFVPDVGSGVLEVRSETAVRAKTGAEMEALQAAAQAALTVYDMCKAVDRGMLITEIGLTEKSGGKSGTWKRR